jgi:hypothetical protein
MLGKGGKTMYKIKEEHESFSKPINLVWDDPIVRGRIKYHPATGLYGHGVIHRFEHKGFGSISAALRWLNENPNPAPGYCQVNGVKSPLAYWFEKP